MFAQDVDGDGKLAYDGSVGSLITDSLAFDYVVSVKADMSFKPQTPFKTVTSLPNNLMKYIVESGNKDRFLVEMIEKNNIILSLEMNKPTLEEIFYKTRGTI